MAMATKNSIYSANLPSRWTEGPPFPDGDSARYQSVGDFLNYLVVEKGASPHTIQGYGTALRRFVGYLDAHNGAKAPSRLTALSRVLTLGRRPRADRNGWSTVTRDVVRDFMANLKETTTFADATYAHQVGTLKSFFKFLAMEEIILRNPMEDFPIPKVPRTLPKTLTVRQAEELLAAPFKRGALEGHHGSRKRPRHMKALRDHAILELLYATGIRISELTGLDVGDIYLEGDNPRIKVLGKGSKERVVPIHDCCRETLASYLENVRPYYLGDRSSDALFIGFRRAGQRHVSRMGAYNIVKQYARMIGLPDLSPHHIRHSTATLLLEGGMDLISIAAILGHANVSTTQIYAHVSVAHLREAYDRAHPRAK